MILNLYRSEPLVFRLSLLMKHKDTLNKMSRLFNGVRNCYFDLVTDICKMMIIVMLHICAQSLE